MSIIINGNILWRLMIKIDNDVFSHIWMFNEKNTHIYISLFLSPIYIYIYMPTCAVFWFPISTSVWILFFFYEIFHNIQWYNQHGKMIWWNSWGKCQVQWISSGTPKVVMNRWKFYGEYWKWTSSRLDIILFFTGL